MSSTIPKKRHRPSMQVIEEVADMKGVATTELSPLYEAIDAEALDTLFQSGTDGEEGIRRIQFQYEGYTIVADTDGDIEVAEADH